MHAVLLLEDGTYIEGRALGHPTEVTGEVVFNTCHTGYEEVVTDPSYTGQMVLFTASHIGNTGITCDDHESHGMHASALICRNISRHADNHRAVLTLEDWLRQQKKTAFYDLDTRSLAIRIREKGALKGILSCLDFNRERLAEKLATSPELKKQNPVADVSTRKSWTTGDQDAAIRIAVLDFGIKKGILNCLTEQGVLCEIFPWDTPAEVIEATDPDGIFLSNGPGDPAFLAENTGLLTELKRLLTRYPAFGICLGHQLIALAFGGKTGKLDFGHHAANHPVEDLRFRNADETASVQITSQNHNYVVLEESIKKHFRVTHRHLNDSSVAGIHHRVLPVFSVQFHPEACPGPHDSRNLFHMFKNSLEVKRARVQ